uniref:Uncharacterized protein n=1 Tax=Lactuca sativa TaxID=4236 RepID=A0A9R1X9N0_LACSA|nr:hypothetical protein LSAT_V11C500245260 [Lactuca sativa]
MVMTLTDEKLLPTIFSLIIINDKTGSSAEEITILLWKECVDSPDKFNRNALTSNSNTVVLAFTNVKSTMYNGRLTLTSTSATHMYINPKILETDTLITRYYTTSTKS